MECHSKALPYDEEFVLLEETVVQLQTNKNFLFYTNNVIDIIQQ